MTYYTPEHLFNQTILVISGGETYDDWGYPVFTTEVVASGKARLQQEQLRISTDDATEIVFSHTAYVPLDVVISGGDIATIDNRKFTVSNVIPAIDGQGQARFKKLILSEVSD